ncbi:DUF1573 domain-containing protein [Pontibacter anaerobius]|uniref:DUF1573 domain-containing protein n=1 Tax=Pontibacter anaerobius TaxID=2993940 RepID=A0ABT3RGA4_9BACT|nr:DUF1573 domain-containing protein [Pontibacter anaerobius]MCX2740466.1 DUF1573 domain-containing protein [Pontibacter anaerobius]
MKKNLFLVAGMALTMLATSCDSNQAGNDTVAENTTAAEAPVQPIENPNVVATAAEGEAATAENAPVMTFEQTEFDFGTIKQGETIEHTFEFTNTGSTPLVIESASATCGCTVPEWTKTPVAPGEKGTVAVKFNSTGKMGQQQPTVTIRANTQPNIVRVAMKGNVQGNSIPTAGSDGPVRRN